MMRAAIFTIDSGIYKAKAESAAASALKRMLEPCTRDYRDRIMKIEQEGQSFLLDSLEK